MSILPAVRSLATLGLTLATLTFGQSEVSYRLLHRWGEPGTDPGQMMRPHGITVDDQGNLLVTDRISSQVQRFTPEGRFRGEIGKGLGSAPGHFHAPSDVKLDAKGNIFVADSGNHRVQVFTAAGRFIRNFGSRGTGPGELLWAPTHWSSVRTSVSMWPRMTITG